MSIQEAGQREMTLSEPRLATSPDAMLQKFYAEALEPFRLGPRLMAGIYQDLAHVAMLAEERIITKENAARITEVLLEIEALGPTNFPIDTSKGGDDFPQVEAYLIDKLGVAVAGNIQMGRSRIDRSATSSRIVTRQEVLRTVSALITLQRALLVEGEKYGEAVMPGYTHLQHAQPLTFGHYLLSCFYQFERDFQRLSEAYVRTNLSPLGTSAAAGSGWPLNRARTAELLAFDGLVVNSKDPAFNREHDAESLAVLALVMSNLSKLANELYLWQTSEFGFVELADRYCGTSSYMPQKKNPDALDRVKSKVGWVMGLPGVMFSIMRMCTSTDLDAVYAPPLTAQASDAVCDCLELMAGVIDTLEVNTKKMKESVENSWATLVNLADELVKLKDLSFREAHRICGRLARICVTRAVAPSKVSQELLDEAAKEILGQPVGLSTEAIREALEPQAFIKSRRTLGSPHPEEVARMLKDCHQKLAAEEAWLESRRQALAHGRKRLEQALAGLRK